MTQEARAGRGPLPGEDSPGEDLYDQAREICLRQLAVRARSRSELAGVLARRQVPQSVAEAVLDRLGEVDLIDDEAFARTWVVQRAGRRGRFALQGELGRKGIDRDVAAQAVAVIPPEQERAAATALARRRLAATASRPALTRASATVNMLARRGFAVGLAREVVRELLAAEGHDLDEPDG